MLVSDQEFAGDCIQRYRCCYWAKRRWFSRQLSDRSEVSIKGLGTKVRRIGGGGLHDKVRSSENG
jgi:hypothetical protein